MQTANVFENSLNASPYTQTDIDEMNTYSEYLNSMRFSITSKGEYNGYSVLFDLRFYEGGSEADIGYDNSAYFNTENNIANTIKIGNVNTYRKQFSPKEDGTITGGFTAEHRQIIMNEPYDDKMNRIHEIFHTLGLPDNPSGIGIMSYPPHKPTQREINSLITQKVLQIQK